ncbi:carboxypeptidase-like regulatory domain-containing protein [Zunongwangia sp. HGR-M22]|uniref:carboxypeptidase-like regulatory domain-containing protein n=1 Tax=Zunongwangia sp. HGR-M22 TaxID=3015168 RepID=UPI0022DE938E|nr:carboxypeptidase-like regulatory domain-containing protein [Zunongwangia sp. HGR-M22]WBL26321.1 carboxypeptidase-like regulatory domain-containing protein [Zunongwangia sp. HGR-M22]
MKNIIIALILIISVQQSFGQRIEGQIINKTTSEAIANVNVIAASEVVAVSGDNGFFTIEEIELPITLKFSAIGFETKKLI